MSEHRLLSCPFCGGEASVGEPADAGDYWVMIAVVHDKCSVQLSIEARWTPTHLTTKTALIENMKRSLVKQWNQRSGAVHIKMEV